MSSECEQTKIGDNVTNDCPSANNSVKSTTDAEGQDDQTKKQLQNKLDESQSALNEEKEKCGSLLKDLKTRTQECDNLKSQVVKLQKELTKKSLKGNTDSDTNTSDAVTRASGVIFEKTKVCKNQELQIEALTQQVTSLKEIVSITKDMLEIRNMEVKQLQDKLDCMELKFLAEKDRHSLIHAKLDRMVKLNTELKSEYEKQFQLFTELQKRYHQHDNITPKTE